MAQLLKSWLTGHASFDRCRVRYYNRLRTEISENPLNIVGDIPFSVVNTPASSLPKRFLGYPKPEPPAEFLLGIQLQLAQPRLL